MSDLQFAKTVERWDVQEVRLSGPSAGNPFVEQWVRGTWTCEQERVVTEGFYDGEGQYLVRFMPSFVGTYTFSIEASFLSEAVTGSFTVLPAGAGNHGPVRVANTFHFAYEDGTPYIPLGTTCYVWNLQSDERIAQTLATLRDSAFTKIRFCVFPKHYDYNLGEPRSYPYEGTPMDSSVLTPENFGKYSGRAEGNHFDYTRFHPAHFRHIESCIRALRDLGIEADLILMHPYDRWGFSCMTQAQNDLYWRYAVARFSAFRNVWWSLANEYDLLPSMTLADWERMAATICEKDPYHHLRSIHNCMSMYDHTRPWVTHCSIQRQDLYKSAELTDAWRARFGKPVVLDELGYEGDIQHGWGNLTGEEMLRRFWEGACRGGYPGHGETYLRPDRVLWWSHGGVLHGESHKCFAFLLDVLRQVPGIGLKPFPLSWDCVTAVPERSAHSGEAVQDFYLLYFSFMRPSFREFYFDDETPLRVRVLDTWNATSTDKGVFRGRFRIDLPGRPYMAIQIVREDA
ncbi:MAG: DUF5605 domain-containing protein [Candidatus Spyradocola sp.]|jgi:hypothetical protein